MSLLETWVGWLPELLRGLGLSLRITAISLALGLPLGLICALLVRSRNAFVSVPVIAIVEIGRGAPLLILLQFAYFGLPSAGLSLTSFTASVAALVICTASYTSEIIRAGLEAVPAGQTEAAEAIGLGPLDSLRFVIIPQGMIVAVPSLLGFAILMLQGTSLCFSIALPELVSRASAIGSSTFQYMSVLVLAGLLYAAICLPATVLVARLERRLTRHHRTT